MTPTSLYPKKAKEQGDQVRKRLTTLGQTWRASKCGVLALLSSETFSSVTVHVEPSNASAVICSAQQRR